MLSNLLSRADPTQQGVQRRVFLQPVSGLIVCIAQIIDHSLVRDGAEFLHPRVSADSRMLSGVLTARRLLFAACRAGA